MIIPNDLCKLNYPIETEEAKAMWASSHKCNRMKAIIAFSLTLENANDNLRRAGYTLQWRKKAIRAFAKYVNNPFMKGIPFTETTTPWWECMPVSSGPAVRFEHWVPSFTGAKGQALITSGLLHLDNDNRIDFNTVFSSSDLQKDFMLVSTDDPTRKIEVKNGVFHSDHFIIKVNNKVVNDKTLSEHLHGIRVKVSLLSKKPDFVNNTYYFGGDINSVMDSISTFIEDVKFYCFYNPNESVFWYGIRSENAPEHKYYNSLELDEAHRLVFNGINGWKGINGIYPSLKEWDDADLWDDDQDWIEVLIKLDKLLVE